MELKVSIPDKEEIISAGIIVGVAGEKESWLKAQLGEYANKSGLYIHHVNGEIIYVGITCAGGLWGNYAERFRREFQKSSSGNSRLHQLLFSQTSPIKSVFYDFEKVDKLIQSETEKLSIERKTLILEQVLIGIYNPVGNAK